MKLIDYVELFFVCIGFILISYGISLIYIPLAFIFIGVSLAIAFSDFNIINVILIILGRNK
jgi:hypothetical protein